MRAWGMGVIARTLAGLYNRFVNARIDSPASILEIPPSHPAGFVREMKKRRITIVESCLIIIRSRESEHHEERIHALKLFEEHYDAAQHGALNED